mgnify:CR=1 FL=1
MKSLAFALASAFAVCSAAAAPAFFQEPFSTEESAKKYSAWQIEPVVVTGRDGTKCLKLSIPKRTNSATMTIPFRPEDLAGCRIEVSGMFRGEKIAPAKEPYNGAKFMLPVTHPGGTAYLGTNIKTGTFPWERYSFRGTVPADATKLYIMLGFQDSFGTLYVRDLTVRSLGRPLDLSKIVNMGLTDKTAADGKGGWSDQGADNDAARFKPRKDNLYGGIPFQVIEPGKNGGKAVLTMKSANFPAGPESAAVSLKLPAKASWLYLLHTMCYNAAGRAGSVEVVGKNGGRQVIPVTVGTDIADWWNPKRLKNAYPASLWHNPKVGTVGIYVSRFKLDPGIGPVKSVTFRSENRAPVWIVLGATLAGQEYKFPDAVRVVTKENAKWRPLPSAKPGVIAGSALDRSALTENTAVTDRIIVNSKGQLARESRPDVPMRFLTVADSYETFNMFKSKEAIEEYARQLRLQGYNMARLHYLDSILMSKATKPLEFNASVLDRFDYYVYCMKKNGVYLNLDAMCSLYGYELGNTWYPDNSGRNFGYDIYFRENVRENWRKGVGKLLTHVNPYTKTRLVDDPVLAIVNGKNEQEFALMAWKYPKKPHYMLPTWRAYLKQRYRTIDAYNAAWKQNVKDWNGIPIFTQNDSTARNVRGEDVARYKTGLESKMYEWYVSELRKIGYNGIVTNYDMGQNLRYIALRRPFHAIGMHSYHAHPSYDGSEQTIDQSSAIAGANAMFRGINSTRMTGKPLLITEYGVVFWNKYRYEEAFTAGAYAAFQDHSALTVHSQTVSIVPPSVIRPFGCKSDPVIHASEFLTAYLFRRGDVAPAQVNIRLDLDTEAMYRNRTFLDGIHHGQSRLCLLTGVSTAVDPDFPVRKNEVALSTAGGSTVITRPGYTMVVDKPGAPFDIDSIMGEFKKQGLFPADNRTSAADGIFENSNNELYMDTRKHFMSVNTPRLQGICAEAGAAPAVLKDLTVSGLTTRGNVAAVSVDGKPLAGSERIVLVYATNALNTGMVFTAEDMRTVTNLGKTPILVETGSFGFRLKNGNAGDLKLYALNTDGSRRFEIPLVKENGAVRAVIDTGTLKGGPSVYFELAVK